MSAFRGGQQARQVDNNGTLRVTAVATVTTGVVLLALIAFRISYAGIHGVALAAGVSPAQAGAYPLILDGALVMACVAGLALNGAQWWMRWYAWLLVLTLLAAMAALDAIHAAGIGLPHRPAVLTMAVAPWVLLLLGLGLLLGVLRHLRGARPVSAAPPPDSRYAPVSANTFPPAGSQPPPAAVPAWDRRAGDGIRRSPPPQPGPTAGLTVGTAGLAAPALPPRPAAGWGEQDEAEGLDGPDVRLLPPGPKPGGDTTGPGGDTAGP